ncbi:MAG: PIN domain-containing protein [Chlamydiae bacterium]|jgi:predicted nucleic acid-binding protein|nr:PIN domain-containing protein [Chlamydiota bacterium]
MVLVDTSVWVDHLRRGEPGLRDLLTAGRVSTHPFVIGELACGNISQRERILALLQSLPSVRVATDGEVLQFVTARRLYGMGLGWIDAHLLASACLTCISLWTRDRRLSSAASRIRVALHT